MGGCVWVKWVSWGREGREGGGFLHVLLAYLVGLFHVGLAPAPLIAHHGGGDGCCVSVLWLWLGGWECW